MTTMKSTARLLPLLLLLPLSTPAATRVWVGAGPSGFWSEGANWAGGVTPASGDALEFPGAALRFRNTNDLAPNTAFASLSFTGPNTNGYELRGNGLVLSGDLVHAGTLPQTIGLPVTQGAALAVRTENASSMLVLPAVWNMDTNALNIATLNGSLVLGASELRGSGPLTKSGSGILQIISSNSFTGPLTIAAGQVSVQHEFGLGTASGGVTIQSGSRLALNGVQTLAESALTFLHGSRLDVVSGTSSVPASMVLTGDVRLSAGPGRELRLTGPVSGSGSLDVQDAGRVVFTGSNSYSGTLQILGGNALVHGSCAAMIVQGGGFLGGTGLVSTVQLNSGTLAPGASPGRLATSNLFLNVNPSLAVELNGLTPGVDYDQVVVRGSVRVDGLLAITLGFTPPPGTVFTIIDNDGSDAVLAPFRNLAEGVVTNVGGVALRISYTGGDGNDVTLTVPGGGAPASTIQFSGLNGNGLFTLTGAGFSNVTYVIEATTNLNAPIPWLPISTNTSGSNGVYQFIDPGSTNFPLRFYRVRSP
jgi:autotransporter-associated beta strand protein